MTKDALPLTSRSGLTYRRAGTQHNDQRGLRRLLIDTSEDVSPQELATTLLDRLYHLPSSLRSSLFLSLSTSMHSTIRFLLLFHCHNPSYVKDSGRVRSFESLKHSKSRIMPESSRLLNIMKPLVQVIYMSFHHSPPYAASATSSTP
jgi:hypothetical protein